MSHGTLRGTVTFIFDDGHKQIMDTAVPIFAKYGVSASVAIYTNGIGATGRMTADDLTLLRSKQWEILSHTVTHTSLKDRTEAEVGAELRDSKQALNNLGFIINGFAAPYSWYPVDTMLHLAQTHYQYMFQGYVDSRTEPVENLVAKSVNRYGLIRANMQYKTLDELKAFVDYAHANGQWLVLYEHKIGEGDHTTVETLDALVKYAKDSNLNIKPPSKVYGMTY